MKLSLKGFLKRHHVDTRPIIMVLIGLGFLSVILAATIIAGAQNAPTKKGSNGVGTQGTKEENPQTVVHKDRSPAVLEKLDTANKRITLYDIIRREAVVLSYNGGTDVTDQYDQIISMKQLEPGIMVDASYELGKLLGMNVSTKAWKYPNVSNMSMDKEKQVIKIASTKYKYNEDIFVRDGSEFVTIDDLAEQDVLTVWGYKETVWSVMVTKGHGIVRLENYENYLGDMISIGYESMLQITENLEIKVREGTYNLTVENGRYSATKSVTVLRNQINYVSLGDIGPVGVNQGEVTFRITPFGADLYVDGRLTDYSSPLELSYGTHLIKASLGGYTSYEGSLDVNSEGKIINIDLPEATSNEEAQVSQTNTGSDTSSDGADDSDDETTTDDTEYSSEEAEYTLEEGESVDPDHKIYIKTPDGSSVYLDGDYMGTAPCTFDKIIGNHVLTFIKGGYETMSYTVEVSDDGVDAYFTFPPLTKSD